MRYGFGRERVGRRKVCTGRGKKACPVATVRRALIVFKRRIGRSLDFEAAVLVLYAVVGALFGQARRGRHHVVDHPGRPVPGR